ncbi:MAG TPA: hypothetical protein QF873_01715, partial [Patescibacteria group bacterium]|nr:hypothetical protein [Patescibacteria group bacterium]
MSASLADQAIPANGFYTTDIEATALVTPPKAGTAVLSVECSCEQSDECPSGGVSYACGVVSGCCSARPEMPVFQPVNGAAEQCRNVEIRIIFDELMDHDSMYADETIIEATEDDPEERIPGDVNILLENMTANSETACDALDSHVYLAKAIVNFEFL